MGLKHPFEGMCLNGITSEIRPQIVKHRGKVISIQRGYNRYHQSGNILIQQTAPLKLNTSWALKTSHRRALFINGTSIYVVT